MQVDFAVRTQGLRRRFINSHLPSASSWLLLAAFGWVLGGAGCSGFSSGPTGTGGRSAAATGGATGSGGTGTGGMTGVGGTTGDGGSSSDSGVDAPAGDTPISDGGGDDVVGPCVMVDGGYVSGDCCPNDPDKVQPGACGCGNAETDSDTDGVPDCIDECIYDPNKSKVGVCGCYVADTDTDNDHTPDCNDLCPKDVMRVVPGPCGCGTPDNAPFCLAHRYTFDDGPGSDGGASDGGTGDGGTASGTTVVRDSVGTANGTAVNVTLNGTGSVTLAGGTTGQYIKLPSGIISSLGPNATFETWVTWTGATIPWERIFDFGNNSGGVGNQGTGQWFIFLTPLSGTTGATFVSLVTTSGAVNEVSGTALLSQNVMHQVVVVIDNGARDGGSPALLLYIDGALVSQAPLGNQLSSLTDDNNWLGRSQFTADQGFSGTYYDFRIYSTALDAAHIHSSFLAGENGLPSP
jgi:Concanavalin A-like lectin/glucanases superfamily